MHQSRETSLKFWLSPAMTFNLKPVMKIKTQVNTDRARAETVTNGQKQLRQPNILTQSTFEDMPWISVECVSGHSYFFPDPTRLFAMQSRCWYYVYRSAQNIPFHFTQNPALMWRKCRENERRALTTNERLIDDRWNFWTNQINHFFFLFCRGHLVLLFPTEVQWTTTWDLLDLGAHLDHWRLNRPPDWVIVKVSWALLLTSLKFNASDSEKKNHHRREYSSAKNSLNLRFHESLIIQLIQHRRCRAHRQFTFKFKSDQSALLCCLCLKKKKKCSKIIGMLKSKRNYQKSVWFLWSS